MTERARKTRSKRAPAADPAEHVHLDSAESDDLGAPVPLVEQFFEDAGFVRYDPESGDPKELRRSLMMLAQQFMISRRERARRGVPPDEWVFVSDRVLWALVTADERTLDELLSAANRNLARPRDLPLSTLEKVRKIKPSTDGKVTTGPRSAMSDKESLLRIAIDALGSSPAPSESAVAALAAKFVSVLSTTMLVEEFMIDLRDRDRAIEVANYRFRHPRRQKNSNSEHVAPERTVITILKDLGADPQKVKNLFEFVRKR